MFENVIKYWNHLEEDVECHLKNNILRELFGKQYWRVNSRCLHSELDTCTFPPSKHKCIKTCPEFFTINRPWDKSHNRFIDSFVWKENHRKLFTSLRLIIFCYFYLLFLLKPAGLYFHVLNSTLQVLIMSPVCHNHWIWMQFFEHNHLLAPMGQGGVFPLGKKYLFLPVYKGR